MSSNSSCYHNNEFFFLPSFVTDIEMCVYVHMHTKKKTSEEQDGTQDQFSKQSFAGLNSEFSLSYNGCDTKILKSPL